LFTCQCMLSYCPGFSTVIIALVGPPLLKRNKVGPVITGAESVIWEKETDKTAASVTGAVVVWLAGFLQLGITNKIAVKNTIIIISLNIFILDIFIRKLPFLLFIS